MNQGPKQNRPSYASSLIAGGIAGTTVDVILFPLDTIKTRLQSKSGFIKSGGFKNIYSGLSSAILGSAPSASLFFLTYESMKSIFNQHTHWNHMVAASVGEMMACIVRVPTDCVKQRMQVGMFNSLVEAGKDVLRKDGVLGFYRGYGMTIFREIPFASIQFPLYEQLKKLVYNSKHRKANGFESSICGMVAGGTAAALTTPLDVVRTRIMLSSKSGGAVSISGICSDIYKQGGFKLFLSGIGPRVMWISIGGRVYESAREILSNETLF
ncbi:hypothetical protein HDV02_003650 [Globomyces sp. JEL0801]|nr:hypothetical protein HDV02_003650 [Globomyces sp. JEL0801]